LEDSEVEKLRAAHRSPEVGEDTDVVVLDLHGDGVSKSYEAQWYVGQVVQSADPSARWTLSWNAGADCCQVLTAHAAATGSPPAIWAVAAPNGNTNKPADVEASLRSRY